MWTIQPLWIGWKKRKCDKTKQASEGGLQWKALIAFKVEATTGFSVQRGSVLTEERWGGRASSQCFNMQQVEMQRRAKPSDPQRHGYSTARAGNRSHTAPGGQGAKAFFTTATTYIPNTGQVIRQLTAAKAGECLIPPLWSLQKEWWPQERFSPSEDTSTPINVTATALESSVNTLC